MIWPLLGLLASFPSSLTPPALGSWLEGSFQFLKCAQPPSHFQAFASAEPHVLPHPTCCHVLPKYISEVTLLQSLPRCVQLLAAGVPSFFLALSFWCNSFVNISFTCHIIRPYIKCKLQWFHSYVFRIYSRSRANITTISFTIFSSSQREVLSLLVLTPISHQHSPNLGLRKSLISFLFL